MKADVYVHLTYDVNRNLYSMNTNLKAGEVEDFLYEFLRTQVGAGKGSTPPAERGVYNVKIMLDMSDDTFFVESDTGNESLTTGIVYDYASRLGIAA